MIKAILVDDETYFRDKVKDKLIRYFKEDIEILGEAESVESAIKIIEDKKPDLLFFGYPFDRWD